MGAWEQSLRDDYINKKENNMARKLVNTKEEKFTQEELIPIIESYIGNKEKEDEYKKKASAENTQIKSIMKELDIVSCETSLGTAKITDQKRETFIEDALIQYLKDNNVADDIIKTKEYVDFDALESAIYNERIPEDIVKGMSKCKEVKTVSVLRISKNKE
jgi:hypothetical protein